jgi:hypothetical protein
MQRSPRLRLGCILNTTGAGSLIRSVRPHHTHGLPTTRFTLLAMGSCHWLASCNRCFVSGSQSRYLSFFQSDTFYPDRLRYRSDDHELRRAFGFGICRGNASSRIQYERCRQMDRDHRRHTAHRRHCISRFCHLVFDQEAEACGLTNRIQRSPRLRLGCILFTTGAGSLIRSIVRPHNYVVRS